MSSPGDRHSWQQSQLNKGDPGETYHALAPSFDAASPKSSRHSSSLLYNPNRLYRARPEELKAQADFLEDLCNTIIAEAEIEPSDILEKETFRAKIEEVARSAITQHERESNGFHDFPRESVQLKCFGSLSSGFATKAADMDLGLLSPMSKVQPDAPGSHIPRLVEKAFLDIGLGARLLTRTRVPIIKVCEKPPAVLRKGLLDERAKWESGASEEVDEQDMHEEPDSHLAHEIHPQDYKHREHKSLEPVADSSKSERRFKALKQGEKKSLSSYYGVAKGLLRKLGGRDLTNSNSSEFKQDDFKFLTDFSIAFVDGITDDKLRERLLSYQSLNRYALGAQPNYRTLHGVYTQVEGEMMAMIWESRRIHEKDAVQEQQALACVRNWKTLGHRANFGLDPIGYAKELQMAADQLRKIPSIQVMLLSQNQHESAADYHTRAMKLVLELGSHDMPSRENTTLHLVIQKYIQGIFMDQIRQQVEEFAGSHALETLTLRLIARRHKSLQLAFEFERYLEKALYS